MSWIQIDTDLFARETNNPVEVVSLTGLQAELSVLQNLYSPIENDIVHEDKNYESVENNRRQSLRKVYAVRIEKTQQLITTLQGL